jgi:hypothetical protein
VTWIEHEVGLSVTVTRKARHWRWVVERSFAFLAVNDVRPIQTTSDPAPNSL